MALALAGECMLLEVDVTDFITTTGPDAFLKDIDGRVTAGKCTVHTDKSNLAQTASTAAVLFVAGSYALYLDKNTVGAASMKIYGLISGDYKQVATNIPSVVGNFETTAIQENSAEQVKVALQWNNQNSTGVVSGSVRIVEGVSANQWVIQSEGTSDGNRDWGLDPVSLAGNRPQTWMVEEGGVIVGRDSYGLTGTNSTIPTTENFLYLPVADEGYALLMAYGQDESFNIFTSVGAVSQIYYDLIDSPGDTPHVYWTGVMPYAPGAGDGGGADVGNGDGQLREGEDNFTDVGGGDWSKQTSVTGASNGAVLRSPSPAIGEAAEWDINFPVAGDYYIGVMADADASGATIDVGVDGDESESGGAQSVPTGGLGVTENQLLFGPFTLAAGDRTVRVTIDAVGSATDLDLDFVAVYPYQADATTPAASKLDFPKTANKFLRKVMYQ